MPRKYGSQEGEGYLKMSTHPLAVKMRRVGTPRPMSFHKQCTRHDGKTKSFRMIIFKKIKAWISMLLLKTKIIWLMTRPCRATFLIERNHNSKVFHEANSLNFKWTCPHGSLGDQIFDLIKETRIIRHLRTSPRSRVGALLWANFTTPNAKWASRNTRRPIPKGLDNSFHPFKCKGVTFKGFNHTSLIYSCLTSKLGELHHSWSKMPWKWEHNTNSYKSTKPA